MGVDWKPGMTAAEAARVCAGSLVAGPADVDVAAVVTDSRADVQGRLFVALVGDRFDAHDFLEDVLARGAAGVVCLRGRAPATAAAHQAVLEVDDTLTALGALAQARRVAWGGTVVAVTGSNGKTSTKEMMRAVFEHAEGADAVLATRGNLNNLIGVPLTLFGLEPRHRVAVVEMGMNVPGEIARLTEITRPDVGLITCVAAAHLEGVGSIEGVARAKGELFAGLGAGATAVVNADDPRVRRVAESFAGRRLLFGLEADDAAVTAEEVATQALDHCSFRLRFDGRTAPVALPMGGRHNVGNALGAAAACLAVGVDLETVAAGLAATQAPPMRMSAAVLPNGVTLVNDAYNANPSSMAAALASLARAEAGRRIVVLGDMRELGPEAASWHRELGTRAAAVAPLLVLAVGEFAVDVVAGARAEGLGADVARECADHDEAAGAVAAAWRSGDVVLVKGSRGSAMERVVERLVAEAGRA
jgi:UDP-N-acetylmuramoyl-tripeptide--D-alanyl-D-alanine ligase